MIPNWANRKVYKLFNEFIERTILLNNSFLTDEENIITIDTLDECINRFIINYQEGEGDYYEKIKRQFNGATYETIMTFAHVNWLWSMSPSDFKASTKKSNPQKILTTLGVEKQVKFRDDLYPNGGFGDAGPSIKFRKHREISFLLLLMKQLKLDVQNNIITNLNEANEKVAKICIESRFNRKAKQSNIIDDSVWKHIPDGKLGMFNILMHLSKPNDYEPIASDGHKDRIRWMFREFIENAPEETKKSNREKQISHIREKIANITGRKDFTFYDNEIRIVWDWGGNINTSDYEFSPLSALQYKKAIILYGAPGTSKTYSAKEIARNAILKYHLSKCSIEEYLSIVYNEKEVDKLVKDKIHRLQLHTNYNYEDFIAGIKLTNGKTEAVKGDLLSLIENVVNKDDYPHVLILDEINRVDLSRLFGEFFSAIENRNEIIKTSVGNFSFSVPDNLLIIGTMNEIDFSLERIDFALRRRFVWFLFGFNFETLKKMINYKQKDFKPKITDDEIEEFASRCENLNIEIKKSDELGEQYQIGHTFFAEIVDIYKQYSTIQGKNPESIFKKNGALKILWDISIKPMLEAFFGNMDKQTRQSQISTLERIYFND